MSLSAPPIKNNVVAPSGGFTNPWVLFFNSIFKLLNNNQPQQIPAYTVSTLPTASTWTGFLVYVSNETGGATVAFSDGTYWRRVQDRAVVS